MSPLTRETAAKIVKKEKKSKKYHDGFWQLAGHLNFQLGVFLGNPLLVGNAF